MNTGTGTWCFRCTGTRTVKHEKIIANIVSEKMKNSLELKHSDDFGRMLTSHSKIGPGIGKIPDSHKIQVKYVFWFLSVLGIQIWIRRILASWIQIHYSEVRICIWILPFPHKSVKQTEIMLVK